MDLPKEEDIIDDASETSEDFESDDDKNDNDDLEEDKVENDDDISDNESIENDDTDDENEVNELLLQGEGNVKQMSKERSDAKDIDDDVSDDGSSDDSDCDEDDNGLQKFNETVKNNLISEFHPEMMEHNESEIELMSTVVRNSNGTIIDELHRSIPFVTKYEKARIIGERARQINSGALPFIDVEPDIIDGYLIAVEEFNVKKIPFIIKRPLPSGKSEYWKLSDLEIM